MPSKAFSISQLGDTDTRTLFVDSANNYVGIGTNTPAVALDVIGTTNTKSVLLSGTVTPSVISANTNDWAPGTTNVFEVRLSANNSTNVEYNITGMAAGSNGQIVIIVNSGTSSIVLRNQNSGSSAANRFALPNDIRLFGSQTLPVYYDGVSQKWRAINSIGVPYFHKVDLTKGFFSGGYTTTYVATADRTTYATETTAAVSGANLSSTRYYPGSAGNADKGFFSGGFNDSYLATADRTTYATETTAAVSGANLSQARYGMGAAGNVDKGFFSGGYTTGVVATADRTTYATETTAAVSGANLSSSRYVLAAA